MDMWWKTLSTCGCTDLINHLYRMILSEIHMKKTFYLCFLMVIGFSCTPEIPLSQVTQIQPSVDESKQLYPDFEKHLELRFRDLKRLEKSLKKAVRKNQNDYTIILTPKNLPNYFRQYIAYVDTTGNKQCWIIGSCRFHEDLKSRVLVNLNRYHLIGKI